MTTLRELAAALNLPFAGDPSSPIDGVGDIEALGPDERLDSRRIYFVETAAVLKRRPRAAEGAPVLTGASLAGRFENALVAPDDSVRLAFIALLARFGRVPAAPAGVSPAAYVHPGARVAASAAVLPGAVVLAGAEIGERCVVHAGAVVEEGAKLGEGSALHANAVLGYNCRVGRDCIIHGGTVIGADGFGFHDGPAGRTKVPQIGDVVIGDHVEIGASCTVDRATIASTTIGDHTKLDDQVHVGHNCRVGRYVYIVGNSALGGSVTVEDRAMISGMVIVKDHVRVARGSVVLGLSGVAQDTEPGVMYFGSPARPARQTHKMNAALERLPELLGTVRALQAEVERLKASSGT